MSRDSRLKVFEVRDPARPALERAKPIDARRFARQPDTCHSRSADDLAAPIPRSKSQGVRSHEETDPQDRSTQARFSPEAIAALEPVQLDHVRGAWR
jgi:hypothetical protein